MVEMLVSLHTGLLFFTSINRLYLTNMACPWKVNEINILSRGGRLDLETLVGGEGYKGDIIF